MQTQTLTAPITLTWLVAPDEQEAFDLWIACRDRWLDGLQRRSGLGNTRRAYSADWLAFFAFGRSTNLMPWQVTSAHADAWREALCNAGLSPATVNRKLATLSSFYHFATYRFPIGTAGDERALWERPNPFLVPGRARVDIYAGAHYPSAEQVRALLNVIPLETVQGWRDVALLMGLYATTRRVSEWAGLRWGDIQQMDGGGAYFHYRYKGGQVKRQRLPKGLWQIVEHYLRIEGRIGSMRDGDYLFVARNDSARHFGNVPAHYDPSAQPISAHQINNLLKSYGRRAGITDDRILHCHALRHAGARARHDAGADILELRDILGHASIRVTQIYTQTVLDQPADRLGDTVLADVLPNLLRVIR